MHPELIQFSGGFSIKTYGFFLMVGFLSAVWMAMRRAVRANVDPDRILDVSFVVLISGVAGARLFYVVHYWQSQFADRPNTLWAIIDIRQGGLEFLGGLLGAIVAVTAYLALKKQSIRLYLDIFAPGAMWGLALGRIGCFFNGCCFGAPCMTDADHQARFVWAQEFPYGSPAQLHQWENRKVTLPAELITTGHEDLLPWPVLDTQLHMPVVRLDGPRRRYTDAKEAFERVKATSPDSVEAKRLEAAMTAARTAHEDHERELASLRRAQQFPSRVAPGRNSQITELTDLADPIRSLPVHPTQLYAAINAMLLSCLLAIMFTRRKRHGVVIAWLVVLYPVSRMLEEMIRADNPHDVAGLTISQFLSLLMMVLGAIGLYVLYTKMPLRSPYADAAAPPIEPEAVPAAA